VASADIVAILRGVPARRLRIFELAEQLRAQDGTFDLDAAGLRDDELRLAENEAELYTRSTQRALAMLRQRLLEP
jgi:hypothetical protein